MKISIMKGSSSAVSAGSARSCYSSNLVTPDKTENWDRKTDLMLDLLKSGHHTTMQHTTITIGIDGMSRLLIWRLLHSHAFYNSDQMSQRYARVIPEDDAYYLPASAPKCESEKLFASLAKKYDILTTMLTDIYKNDPNPVVARNAKKRAMEMARYVLPQATKAHLYHTISLLTALRYIAAVEHLPEARSEGRLFAVELEKLLLEADPSLSGLIERVKRERHEVSFPDLKAFPDLPSGKKSLVFGEQFFSEKSSSGHESGLNLNTIFYPEERFSSFLVRMKLSLSADAQNQRHRTSIGLRPKLNDVSPRDYYIPDVISANNDLLKIYLSAIRESEEFIKNQGPVMDKEDIPYYFLNAMNIEIVEKNDLDTFTHKAKLRTCLNAQEEIRFLTEDILIDLAEKKFPGIEHLVPPCVLRDRKGVKPICPEGSRFCGIKLWKDKKYQV